MSGERQPVAADEINRMDIAEFRERGYLQEVNRQWFHPLGLALEVVIAPCGPCEDRGWVTEGCGHCHGEGTVECLGGIWDYRDDPEGILYDPEDICEVKAAKVISEQSDASINRLRTHGFVVQPAGNGLTSPEALG